MVREKRVPRERTSGLLTMRERYIALRAGRRGSGRHDLLVEKLKDITDTIQERETALAMRQKELRRTRNMTERTVMIHWIQGTLHLLAAARQEQRGYERQLRQLRTERVDRDRYGKEFDRLLMHPAIADIRITRQRIILMTKPIRWKGAPGGRSTFRITICTGDQLILIQHRPQTRNRFSPPDRTSEPCFGNIARLVGALIREGKYAALANLLIEFVRG